MMKRCIFSFIAIISAFHIQAQDPVLLCVNGQTVTRGEFEYEFNKNNNDGAVEGNTVDEYLPMFIAYKLKVQAAYSAHYDTLSSYQKEFRMYRDQLIRPMLVTQNDIEAQVREYYDKVLWANIGEKGLCHAAHIFIGVKQKATEAELSMAKARIDSIYTELKLGGDFAELARKHSQDGSARHGGDLGTFGPGRMIKEFEDVAYGQADGTYSAPIQTAFGWHIVKTIEHRPLDSYETLHDQIKTFLERQNIREYLAATITDSLSRQRGITQDELMDQECERICALDSDTRFLVKEYREGLLLFEICDREIWQPAQADIKGQDKYFKTHRKDYTWNEPRYIGAVLQATDDATMAQAGKLLNKTKDHTKWTEVIKQQMNKDSVRVRIEYRLFSKNDNKWVDYQVFGIGEKPVTTSKKYPIVKCFGKILKKRAEKRIDVCAQVQQDYQRYCEAVWTETLKKKYPVWVDQNVLQTVNNH